MKPLLIALVAGLLAPTAALAQVAAATVPNSFERPAAPSTQAPARTPPAATTTAAQPELSQERANARSEDILRALIASMQAGTPDYSLMTENLATKMREQEATLTPLIRGFGTVQAVDFVGSREGVDLYAVTFATQATEWLIAVDENGKLAVALFRPAS